MTAIYFIEFFRIIKPSNIEWSSIIMVISPRTYANAFNVSNSMAPSLISQFCQIFILQLRNHAGICVVTRSFRVFCAMTPLTGTMSNMRRSPARTDGPSCCHRKYMHRAMVTGDDHAMWRYPGASCNFWASTDIKLTITPVLVSRLAAVLSRKACRELIT